MTIKNLSQFKKWLDKGNKIQFLENTMKPEMANGQIREVNIVQTNSFTTLVGEKDSWLEFPKAKELMFNSDGTIDFINNYNGEMWLKIKPLV